MASALGDLHQASTYGKALDEAVEEVFRLMMGVVCMPVVEYVDHSLEAISVLIGLAGAMSGTFVLRSNENVALRMAERLVGYSISNMDDVVKDAVGEICNMIAGAWKGRHPYIAAACMLSTPTVVTGTNYHLHTHKPKLKLERYFQFEDLTFALTLICEAGD